jgi:hypothetical protein
MVFRPSRLGIFPHRRAIGDRRLGSAPPYVALHVATLRVKLPSPTAVGEGLGMRELLVAKLRQWRRIMEEPIPYGSTQEPLDDEERELMDPQQLGLG